ncbi:MAG: azurin [Pseudomonadota bacterium]
MRNKLLPALVLALFAGPVMAADCEFTIEGNDALQFSTNLIEANASCGTVKVTLKHTGKLAANVMGHNFVLSASGDFQAVATDAVGAGLDNNYVPPGDKRVLAATKIIGGGESTSVDIDVSGMAGKEYTFFCSFPGHWSIMKGTFRVK